MRSTTFQRANQGGKVVGFRTLDHRQNSPTAGQDIWPEFVASAHHHHQHHRDRTRSKIKIERKWERISAPSHNTFDNEENLQKSWRRKLSFFSIFHLIGPDITNVYKQTWLRRRLCKNEPRGERQTERPRQVSEKARKDRKIWETFRTNLVWIEEKKIHVFFFGWKFLVASIHNIFRLFFSILQTAQKTSRLLYIYIFMINILIYKHLDILYWIVWGHRLNFCFRLVKFRSPLLPFQKSRKKSPKKGEIFWLFFWIAVFLRSGVE